MKVEAGKGLRKDVHILKVDDPDPFGHRVPEEVVEGDVRGTEETSLGLEGGQRDPGVVRVDAPRPIATRERSTWRLEGVTDLAAMHLI